jgi:flagellar basal-body rod modification protein FlgD
LQLLTTQLKNQSPLDPLDTNQFTQQLVQFASVEQQLKTNDTLTALLSLSKATSTSNALSYVGSTITAVDPT